MSKGRGIFRQPRQDYIIEDSPASQKHFHYHGSKVKGNDQEKCKFIKYFPRISSAETPSNIQCWLEQNGLLEIGFNKKRIVALKELSPKLNLGDKNIRIFKSLDRFKDKNNKKRSRRYLLHKSRNRTLENKTSWIDLEDALQENMGEELFDEEVETYETCREDEDISEKTTSERYQKYHKIDVGTETSTSVKIISLDRGGGDLLYTNIEKIQSTTAANRKRSLSTIEILSARTDLTTDSFHSICTQTSVAQSQPEKSYALKKGISTLNFEVSEQSSGTHINSKVVIKIYTTKSGKIKRNHSVANENKYLHRTKSISTIGILNEPDILSESFGKVYNQSMKDHNSKLKVHKDNETVKIVAVRSSGTNTDPIKQIEPRLYQNKQVQVEMKQSSSACEIPNITNIPLQKQLERIINLQVDTKPDTKESLKILITPLTENSTKTDSIQNLNSLEKDYGGDKQIQTENVPKRKVSLFRVKSNVCAKKVRKNRKVRQLLDSMELVQFRNSISMKNNQSRRSEPYFPSGMNYQTNCCNKCWLTLAPNENNISDYRGSQEVQNRNGDINLKSQNHINTNFRTYFAKAFYENSFQSKVKNSDSETRKNMIYSNRNKTGDGPDQIVTVKEDNLEPIYKHNKSLIFHGKNPDECGSNFVFNKEKLLQKIDEGVVVNSSIDRIYYVVDKITQTPRCEEGETVSKHFVKTMRIQSRKRSKKLHKLDHKSTQMYEYLTANQLYCRDWIRRNLFYIAYLNPFTTFLSKKTQNDSTKSNISL